MLKIILKQYLEKWSDLQHITEQITPAKMQKTDRKPRRMGSQRSKERRRGPMDNLTEEAETPAELMATHVYSPDTEAARLVRVRVDTMSLLVTAVTSNRYEEAF